MFGVEEFPVKGPQLNPDKTPMQLELHPLLSKAPSSHVSFPTVIPSPQIGEQTVEVVEVPPVQDHPSSSPLQAGLQPSVTDLLSSQVSGDITQPSPQITVQIFGVGVFGVKLPQLNPTIFPIQLALHPLPSVESPSSQVSEPTR